MILRMSATALRTPPADFFTALELTEEMAEQWLAKMGLLSLVENGDEFAECQKQLKKMKGRGRVCKQYDIGNNIDVFTMTRVLDNVETHRRHNVDATIMLFGPDRPDARYVLQVKYAIPGIPDFLAITHALCFLPTTTSSSTTTHPVDNLLDVRGDAGGRKVSSKAFEDAAFLAD